MSVGTLELLALRLSAAMETEATIVAVQRELRQITDVGRQNGLDAIVFLGDDLLRRTVRWSSDLGTDLAVRAEVVRHTALALGFLLELAPVIERINTLTSEAL